MQYIFSVLLTASVLVGSVATLNWTIDPAGIFRKTTFGRLYAEKLVASEHGLLVPNSLDEREFKAELATQPNSADCIVIGSSHVMQVGSARKHRSFPTCKSILNLGVSGAGIEDHLVLTWLAVTAGRPRTLILGIDPWTFAFGKDERWKVRYAEQYSMARISIDRMLPVKGESINRWSSLVSAQYTRRSLAHILSGTTTRSIKTAQSVDEDIGDEFPITLPDGSHVYSAEFIKNQKKATIPVGGSTYKTDGVINDPEAINLYRLLLIWAKANGVKPILLMTPYHQNVWMLQDSQNVLAMASTEAVVREMSSQLDVLSIGSYRPDFVSCLPIDFYDYMHPMASCIAKFTNKAEF